MNSMYLVASSLEIFKRQNSYKLKHTISFFFLLRPNWNDSKIFRTRCNLPQCFLFHVILEGIFHKSLPLHWSYFSRHITAFFESVLKEDRILRYLHNKSAVSLHQRFLKKLILYLINFILWFWLFLTFLYKWLSFFFFFSKSLQPLEPFSLAHQNFIVLGLYKREQHYLGTSTFLNNGNT